MIKKTTEQQLKTLEKKYKKLAEKHRTYLMQEYVKKKQREKTFSTLKQIIFKLCKKILEITSDENLLETTEQIQKIVNKLCYTPSQNV